MLEVADHPPIAPIHAACTHSHQVAGPPTRQHTCCWWLGSAGIHLRPPCHPCANGLCLASTMTYAHPAPAGRTPPAGVLVLAAVSVAAGVFIVRKRRAAAGQDCPPCSKMAFCAGGDADMEGGAARGGGGLWKAMR